MGGRMRLKYLEQKTQFTCEQATAAIVLNSLLNRNYTDIYLARTDYPLRLGHSMIMHGFHVYGRNTGVQLQLADLQHLSTGLYEGLLQGKKLENFWKAIELARIRYRQALEKSINSIRNNPVKKTIVRGGSYEMPMTEDEIRESVKRIIGFFDQDFKELDELSGNRDAERFYQTTSCHMNEDLFEPIGYNFTTEDMNETSILNRISEGKVLGRFVPSNEVNRTVLSDLSETGIVKFSARREQLKLAQHSQWTSHAWVIDRVEGENAALLDTNHHLYDHGPEVMMPLEQVIKAVSSQGTPINCYCMVS